MRVRVAVLILIGALAISTRAFAACTWPNEPAGATLVNAASSDVQFNWQPVLNGAIVNGWNWNAGSGGPSALVLVNNPLGLAAPCDGSGNAWDFIYSAGLGAGLSPASVEQLFTNWPTGYTSGVFYMSFWFMYGNGFINQPLNKGLQFCQLETNQHLNPCVFYELRAADSLQDPGPTAPWVDIEVNPPGTPSSANFNPNIVQFAQGQWHQAEITMDLSSLLMKVWGDGLLVYNQTMPNFMVNSINGVYIFPAWGGNCPTPCPLSQTQHWYLSHVRISISTGGGPPPPPASPCCLTVTQLIHEWFLKWLPWTLKRYVV